MLDIRPVLTLRLPMLITWLLVAAAVLVTLLRLMVLVVPLILRRPLLRLRRTLRNGRLRSLLWSGRYCTRLLGRSRRRGYCTAAIGGTPGRFGLGSVRLGHRLR